MKTNYDPNNGEQIEGKSIHDVMAAARVRFGELSCNEYTNVQRSALESGL